MYIIVCPLVFFPLTIVLYVPLRFTAYDCPFGIINIFLPLAESLIPALTKPCVLDRFCVEVITEHL